MSYSEENLEALKKKRHTGRISMPIPTWIIYNPKNGSHTRKLQLYGYRLHGRRNLGACDDDQRPVIFRVKTVRPPQLTCFHLGASW